MKKELISKLCWQAHYIRKPGANAMFLAEGFADLEDIPGRKAKQQAVAERVALLTSQGRQILLPIKVGFITDETTAKVSASGRGLKLRVAQMKASFTIPEQSPYKQHKPWKVCTSIWQVAGYKCLFWGTIGITPAENLPPADNGDLVLFHTADWKEVDIRIFKGLAKPNDSADLAAVVDYLEEVEGW